MEDFVKDIIVMIFVFCIGLFLGAEIAFEEMKIEEIQEVKEVDNGYYITINNEIYYKENSNE